MAELADALDLGSSSERSEGSSPFIRIYKEFRVLGVLWSKLINSNTTREIGTNGHKSINFGCNLGVMGLGFE